MPNYDTYSSFKISIEAQITVNLMQNKIDKAIADGWTDLYFAPDEENFGLDLMGVKPPDPEEIRKAKEKRRKQYERLKKEFGGDA